VSLGMGQDQKFDTWPRNWSLHDFKVAVRSTQDIIRGTDAWTVAFIENHDQARSISRFGSDETLEKRIASGKMLAMLQSTLSGTLFIYQGQEIGMTNFPETWAMSEYKDVDSNNYYKYVAEKSGNNPAALKAAKKALQHLARDHGRTPMQWDASANGGFTSSSTPWMRVNDNYPEINADNETSNPKSILNFWRQMLDIRKQHADVLVYGLFEIVDEDNEKVFIYKKQMKEKTMMVALNFTDKEQFLDEKLGASKANLIVSNYDGNTDVLRAYEGRLYLIES